MRTGTFVVATLLALATAGSAATLQVGDLQVEVVGRDFRLVQQSVGVFVEGSLGGARPGRLPQVTIDQQARTLTVGNAQGGRWVFTVSEDLSTVTLTGGGRQGAGLRVRAVRWGKSPLPCRLDPGDQGHIVHTQVGLANHPACDSLFDPASDSALTFTPGGPQSGFLFTARIRRDFMKKERGLKYYQPIDKSVFATPPSGWCSWYYYYRGLTEAEAIKNLDWMAENLVPFGATYFQIDDIWQGRGDADEQEWRDWSTTNEAMFPHGMKWLADQIHAKGMKPGIWLACFGQSSSAVATASPNLWLVDDKGRYVDAGWVGKYLCDPSNPRSRDYLRDLFSKLAKDWGYDYFKIDGQPPTVALLKKHQASLRDPLIAGDDAYRLGLKAIRDAIGPNRFLLGCWGTPWEGLGIMDGSRTGGDIAANWRGFQPALDCTLRSLYTHNVAWYNDPDVLCVRPPLTLDQARCWASLYGLTGQLLMASDKMYELPPDRVEILKRVFPPADIKPMCLYPQKGKPRVWHLAARIPGMGLRRDVVGLFNWEERAQTVSLRFADLDPSLGVAPVGVYDFWNKRYLGRFAREVSFVQRPTSCDVLSVVPLARRPQLLSTSRHLTQGAVDLAQADWEPANRAWSGVSHCVAGDPYTLTFLLDGLQGSWTVSRANTSGPAPAITREGPIAKVTFRPEKSGDVVWRVEFLPAPSQPPHYLGQVTGLVATSDNWRSITVTWEPVPEASAYRLTRDGEPLGLVLGTEFQDSNLKPASEHVYSVRACGLQGQLGPASAETRARTLDQPARPAKPSLYLADLKPVSVKQGWGQMRLNKSVDGNALRIGDETFSRGIGTHAVSEIVYDLIGLSARRFVALVGIDREIGEPQGSCAFQVFVDGKRRFDSGVLTLADGVLGVDVDVTGAKQIRLVVTDGGDGINYDHADWAEAGFVK